MPFPDWVRSQYGAQVHWTCEVCGRQWGDGWMLEFHHIIPLGEGGNDSFENIECLCVRCHLKRHQELLKVGIGDYEAVCTLKERLLKYRGRRFVFLARGSS